MGIENELNQKIETLSGQIAKLAQQQTALSSQIIQLMDELDKLKLQAAGATSKEVKTPSNRVVEIKEIIEPPPVKPLQQPIANSPGANTVSRPSQPVKTRNTLEEFIGGNLASKVGILITVIGIFIGTKYAIEHNLVNPVIRVISGYLSGLALIGVALRLKNKYEQYSAVLMGGGLSVLYFITYVAYSFYGMMPQLLAFALMLVFTAATVYASLIYNRIVIAHLGLVGAYAIPILLSDQSGRYGVLFTYIAIINAGILVLSFRKYWKSLFYVSYVLTWLIYTFWITFQYRQQHFTIAIVFLFVFFFIFYATFLAYKLIKKEQYGIWDVIVLLSNAFIFYSLGYTLLSEENSTDHLLGVFTLANAAIHLGVSMLVRHLKLADKALFYLLLGLVIAFITIAIPVQLDGNWVTLLWTTEAVLVFYTGRKQQRPSYEKLAVILTLLSFLSLLEDWSVHFDLFGVRSATPVPFLNIVFLTGILVSLAQLGIIYLHNRKFPQEKGKGLHNEFYNLILPCLFLITTYFIFELELETWFRTIAESTGNESGEVALFQFCGILLYSMVFVGIIAYLNKKWLKIRLIGSGALLGIFICIFVLLIFGLDLLNNLSSIYFSNVQTYFGVWNLLIRYVIFGAVALLLIIGDRTIRSSVDERMALVFYSVFTHITILTIISFEYLNWMSSDESQNEYKLGLSIVWSIYALSLVVLGINKKKKHWRLTGILFFLVTVVKLFLYDLNQTTTISKTVSFISLGVILLLVSYLYNRYKHVIMAEDEELK
ncbi:MAG TPA: DUF2339 domain-containing protein [Chitinophagaceae bacterium]